jgi:hypothetical protein
MWICQPHPPGVGPCQVKRGVYPLFFFRKKHQNGKKGKPAPCSPPDAQRKTVSSKKCVKHYFISTDLDLMRAVTTAPRVQVSSTNAVKQYIISTDSDLMRGQRARRASPTADGRPTDSLRLIGAMPTAVGLR